MYGLDRRFRAVREGSLLRLAGAATNTTNAAMVLTDLLDDSVQRVDLAGVLPSSWMGLRSLHDALLSLSRRVVLTGVPEDIFRHLKIIDSDRKRLVFDTANVYVQADSIREMPVKLSSISRGPHGFAADGGVPIIGVPSLLAAGWEGSPVQLDATGAFMVNYAHFLLNTVDLGGGLLTSLQIELTEIVRRLVARVASMEHGIALLWPHEPALSELVDFLVTVDAVFVGPCARYTDLQRELLVRCATLQRSLDLGAAKEARDAFASLCDVEQALMVLTARMEQTGTALGEQIAAFSFLEHVERGIRALAGLDLTGDALDTCRSAFELMDPDSEDCFALTHSALLNEVLELGRVSGEFSTALQGFDLARQVLEHRMAELAFVASLDHVDAEAREHLHDKIAGALVTDQETCAYGTFFPEEKARRACKKAMAPGEFLFF